MLKLLTVSLMIIPLTWTSPPKHMWSNALVYSILCTPLTMILLSRPMDLDRTFSNMYMSTDALSGPLLMLNAWFLPLALMATQGHLRQEPFERQRLFISMLAALHACLIGAFAVTDLFMFFIMFEAVLIPILIIVTRWGSQNQRLQAGYYMLFYTLFASLPLMVALFSLYNSWGSLSLWTTLNCALTQPHTIGNKLWWLACLCAFMVKLPLYGTHLWLPKAHVEAPIAGSMILAAILLKLGGYGMIRMMTTLQPLTNELSYPFIVLALWGVVMTSSICLRQTDLKSLIAYSSVSHMGLVAAGILTQTPWGLTGALVLMIAHGLTSSLLFCLANTNYERTHSRTMILARGLQMALPLMSCWWFLAALANLALPPLPNLMGEMMVIISLYSWSWWTLALTGAGMFITAAYSLHMYLSTQRGPLPLHILAMSPNHTREHLLIVMHLLPLVLLMIKPELIWGLNF
uniref:NADH dehydrogenase subunit 4 n=1 Tax=Chromis acares TaxID=997966 RepID=UPI0028D3374D|nr:NADH dehydrogenase subunit 4 [Chromis acares]WMY90613.1 NADH dehydrogenase subunit 4 [Chromis acares]WNH23862.1 NADH dehydrogenase subunit 4 [Chromis acares]